MRLPAILAFSSILVIAFLTTLTCKPRDPFVYTPISGVVVIDTLEHEFIFDKPFKPKKMVNKVCFEYSDELSALEISQPPKFPDGTELKLTATIVDQNGRNYELDDIENSVEGYLCIRHRSDDWLDISKGRGQACNIAIPYFVR